ncbi:MAG: hypothetical protein RIE55_00440 [Marinoscillum sp.]
MEKKFEIKLLEEAFEFIKSQNEKVQDKIFYNIRKAQILNDPKLFKKLNQTFGNSEPNTQDFNIGFLLLGQGKQ